MLNMLYKFIFTRCKKQTIFKYKYVYSNKIYKYTTPYVYNIRPFHLKKNTSFGYSRSFCSSHVKYKANTFVSIKDLISNLQAESSADAARRITRAPNPNRIACLVRRIYTIFIENDLDTKINNMSDLLSENF
jgi:hypothetical protein